MPTSPPADLLSETQAVPRERSAPPAPGALPPGLRASGTGPYHSERAACLSGYPAGYRRGGSRYPGVYS